MNHVHEHHEPAGGGVAAKPAPAIALYIALGAFVLGVAAIGYFAFFRTILAGEISPAAIGFVLFAVISGLAAFFSPCGLSLLPAYFSLYFSTFPSGSQARIWAVAARALAASLGLLAFLALLGALTGVLGAGVESLKEAIPLIRRTIGIILIALGISHLAGIWNYQGIERFVLRLPFVKARGSSVGAFGVYGFGYALGGAGCSIAILGSLFLFGVAGGGLREAFSIFGVAAITMAALMFGISLLVGLAQSRVFPTLIKATPVIQRLAGFAIIAAGFSLLFLVKV